MDMELVVVGTPRSGTVYMSKVLTELGIPCGHETIFNENGISEDRNSWKLSSLSLETTGSWVDPQNIVADSSYFAVPFLNQLNCKKIHVVRNPLKVIRSLSYGINYFSNSVPSNKWEKFIYNYLPELNKDMSQLERTCLFYVSWNKMIKSDFMYKLEDDLILLTDYLKIPFKEVKVSNKTNTFTYEKVRKPLFLEDIPNGEIKNLFINYCVELNYDLNFRYFF